MLSHLGIENFVLVKQLDLDFSQGMAAFTGETGAGKSIMIDALALALGERADVSVIRRGEEQCKITAGFYIDQDSEPALWLARHEIPCEDGEIILRRVLYAEGRSKSTINGQPFPLQKIRELSALLVHIHGQHQQQTLMQHSHHRLQLDLYAGHQDLLAEVGHWYKQCHLSQQALEKLQKDEGQQDRVALLAFQIEELSQLDPQTGEAKQLDQEHQLLHHAKSYLQQSEQILSLIEENEHFNLFHAFHQLLQMVNTLPQEQLSVRNAAELLNSALIQLEEAKDEIGRFAERVHLDPARLELVEKRMAALHQAARKYHVPVEQLSEKLRQLLAELEQLEGGQTRKLELQALYQQQTLAYEQAAMALRQSRQLHAKKLADEITAIIRQLGMPKGSVEIEITALDKMQPTGMDRVEYKVCTNPGIAPDLLSKIASGGELSRISLAIQMICAQRGATPTLLFDEVDVGIGGATAALVGQLLRELGERLQVFCVTHQPQVAASAHHHFVVEKQTDNEQTFSRIFALGEKERIDEIARMLGGLTITEQTRSHAEELLMQAKESADECP